MNDEIRQPSKKMKSGVYELLLIPLYIAVMLVNVDLYNDHVYAIWLVVEVPDGSGGLVPQEFGASTCPCVLTCRYALPMTTLATTTPSSVLCAYGVCYVSDMVFVVEPFVSAL